MLNQFSLSGAVQSLANALYGLRHGRFAGDFQAQLPGNVVDAGWIERQAAGIDGRHQIPGALLSGRGLSGREPGLEPLEGSFGEHVEVDF